MSNPKEPFVLIPGDDYQTAMRNRVMAIDRINYLSGIDLRTKSVYFRNALDLEMWERWYKKYPRDHKIDEEWIQRAVEVIKSMVDDEIKNKRSSELATSAFKEYKLRQVFGSGEVKKVGFVSRIKDLYARGLKKIGF
jgi:hypothetical protein